MNIEDEMKDALRSAWARKEGVDRLKLGTQAYQEYTDTARDHDGQFTFCGYPVVLDKDLPPDMFVVVPKKLQEVVRVRDLVLLSDMKAGREHPAIVSPLLAELDRLKGRIGDLEQTVQQLSSVVVDQASYIADLEREAKA